MARLMQFMKVAIRTILRVSSITPHRAGSWKQFVMRILLAVDGLTYSDVAIEEIASRPWPPCGEVKIIIAAETPVMVGMEPWAASPAYFDQLEKSVRKNASTLIDRALSRLSTVADKTSKISNEMIPGPPRQVILEGRIA